VSGTIPVPSIMGTFISQLRTNAPIFAGRVAGAAEFYAGLKNYNTAMVLPSAYVLPLGQEAEGNQAAGGDLIQIVHKSVGVAVELDATPDRRGQDPVMQFQVIETQLFASVLNMILMDACPRMSKGVYFQGARYLDLDRARLFYQWEFGLDWQIGTQDGVQPQSIPLAAIEVDIFKAPVAPGDAPPAVVHIPTGDPPYPPATDGPWPHQPDPPV
jgi:hypothetical protein